MITDSSVPDDAPEIAAWQNKIEHLRDNSHFRNYSPKEWHLNVEKAAFNVEKVARCDESVPITLNDWLQKSGCTGTAAEEVRRMFAEAPEAVRREFSIHTLPDGDTAFQWMRVVLSATRSPS